MADTRPRAAPMNKARTGSARPSALASNRAVSLRAVRLIPRSRSLTDRGLSRAAPASASCVIPAWLQLPQQPGEPLRRLLRHGPGILLEPHHSGTRRFGMARKGPAQRLPRPGCPHHLLRPSRPVAPWTNAARAAVTRRRQQPRSCGLRGWCMCGGHPRTSATVELAGGRTSAHTAGHHGPSRTNRRGCRRSRRSLVQVSEKDAMRCAMTRTAALGYAPETARSRRGTNSSSGTPR